MSQMSVLKPLTNYTGLTHGCYYVRKLVSGWILYHQSFQDGKKIDTKVAPLAYRELGFKHDWSLEEARTRCKSLNKEKTLHHTSARKAAAILRDIESVDKILFPQERVDAFIKRLEQSNEGTQKHLIKMKSHFLKIQRIAADLQILPHQYKEHEKFIFKWLERNRVSLDYSQKLISLLNRWGTFYSRLDGRYFEPISPMRGISRERVREAHEGKKGVRTESKPISPTLLKNRKEKLRESNYNFLFITVWLGLRPIELRRKPELVINKDGLSFVVIYQSKLTGIEKSKRFKAIPLLNKEQHRAADLLVSGNFQAPIYKTMLNVFGPEYGLYGGRKGFVDLMLSLGYLIEDISIWLGHTSIDTTWKHYKIKNSLELKSPRRSDIKK